MSASQGDGGMRELGTKFPDILPFSMEVSRNFCRQINHFHAIKGKV